MALRLPVSVGSNNRQSCDCFCFQQLHLNNRDDFITPASCHPFVSDVHSQFRETVAFKGEAEVLIAQLVPAKFT